MPIKFTKNEKERMKQIFAFIMLHHEYDKCEERVRDMDKVIFHKIQIWVDGE